MADDPEIDLGLLKVGFPISAEHVDLGWPMPRRNREIHTSTCKIKKIRHFVNFHGRLNKSHIVKKRLAVGVSCLSTL